MLQRAISFRRPVLLCCVFFLAVSLIVPVNAAAFQGTKKKAAGKKPASDPYAVPEGDSKKLLAFVTKLVRLRPRFRSPSTASGDRMCGSTATSSGRSSQTSTATTGRPAAC